jgi:hypothetical protein
MPEEVRITAIVVTVVAAILLTGSLYLTRRFAKKLLWKFVALLPIAALLFALVTSVLIAGGTGDEQIAESPCYEIIGDEWVEVPCPSRIPEASPVSDLDVIEGSCYRCTEDKCAEVPCPAGTPAPRPP